MDGSLGPAVRRTDVDGVATLILDRPASRNALSLAMLDALHGALAAIAAERDVRCVVLAAEGPAFSAGHDLREITAHRDDPDGGAGFFAHAMERCSMVMQAIAQLPQPVIAAVRGIATAAGCQLVAACDLAVAGRSARFATPGVNIGLFCSTPAVALGRAVPPKAAAEMLLTGAMIDAEEARRIFLVNRVVEDDQVLEAAHALAQGIAARSAVTVRMGKAGYARQIAQPLDQAYATASAVMVRNLLTEDASEGIGAFLAKRHPSWRHR